MERETGAVLCVIESYRAGGFTVRERERERERERCILPRRSIQLQYFPGCFVKKSPEIVPCTGTLYGIEGKFER